MANRSRQRRWVVSFAFGALAAVSACSQARMSKPRIRIAAFTVRSLPNGTGVGYPEIANGGGEDTLVSVDSTDVQQISIHETRVDGDLVRMREPEHGVPIDSRSDVQFTPGGRHLMFRGIQSRGTHELPLTFHFARAGAIRATAELVTSVP